MLDIRLVAEADEQAHWSQVSRRLRRAHLDVVRPADVPALVLHDGDAVILANQAAVEISAVERLLSAGKHVLVCGPLAAPWLEWGRLSAAAQRASVQWSVVNPDRYLPSRQLVRQETQARLGEVGLIRTHRWRSQPAALWQGLPQQVVHDLDLVLWLAARPVDHVFAVRHSAGGCWQVHLGWPDGMALIDYTDRLPTGTNYQSLSVIGASGAAYADDHQNMQLALQDGAVCAVPTGEGLAGDVAMLQAFVDGVLGGNNLTAATVEWQRVLAVAAAAVQSAQTGQAVNVAGTLRVP